jgi:hypothetical protein
MTFLSTVFYGQETQTICNEVAFALAPSGGKRLGTCSVNQAYKSCNTLTLT